MANRLERERILIVDDSEMNRSILADMLADEFDVSEAEDGDAALELLEREGDGFSLVLLDIVMPGKNGFDVLWEMNRTHRIEKLPVIMVSSETASDQIERAYELGATDFIMRPFDASIVHHRVVNTILLYAKQKKLLGVITAQIEEKERYSSLMVDILSHIVEFRNGESGLHILHVRTITDLLLRALVKRTDRYALTDADISRIGMASALHDIGKIAIDDRILNKPGRLTEEEYAVMKTHSLVGAQMLDSLSAHADDPLVRRAYEICRWHHERYDGNGYPDGLKGDEIPISAQIVALADVYDALTSKRVYKAAIPAEEAKEMILAGKCGKFNPLLLECFTDEFSALRDTLEGDERRKAGKREIRSYVDDLLHARDASVSDRTLKLLDYERMKFDFYAELTQEIQFEYLISEDLLKLSPWGARKFGVEEKIVCPAKDERLTRLFGAHWFDHLLKKIGQTSPKKPEFRQNYLLALNEAERWYEFIMRVIYADAQAQSVLGKLVDVHDVQTRLIQLKESATRDPLTGLLNRAGVTEELAAKLSAFPQKHYTLAIFDLDDFKIANDEYGHQFGDKVLCEFAARLMHNTRQGDVCARLGGDEFLVVFEHTVEIHPIFARVFAGVCCKVEDFALRVSAGVAEMLEAGEPYDAIFQRADIALYTAKQQGKGRYCFYDKSMGESVATSASDAGYGRTLTMQTPEE